MLSEFIAEALGKAQYELLENNEWYYGEIPGFAWVWAQGNTLETCRNELREVLEEWLIIKIRKQAFVPESRSYDLNTLICESSES